MPFPRFAALCRNLFHRDAVETQLDAELRSFLDLSVDEKIRRGIAPEQARRAALIELEGMEQAKEAARDARSGAFIDSTLRDLRYGLRVLLKKPAFFATASATLALGIGAATTLFSVVESQLWRPLPFPEPERLVAIWAHNLKHTWVNTTVSAPDFLDWRERSHSFDRLAAEQGSAPRNFSANGIIERPRVSAISAAYFETLGVNPAAGHAFTRTNEQPGHLDEAILSDPLSRRAFGSPAGALSKTIRLNGIAYTVVGVLPPAFQLQVLRTADVFVPLAAAMNQRRDDRLLTVIGRLHRGVSLNRAQAEMETLTRQLAAEHPDTNGGWSARVENLRASLTAYARPFLLLYFSFSVFVLTVACANVAELQLVRSVARQNEFAIREALGASRSTLIRQAVAESAWIAITGAALGILLAVWGMHALQSLPLDDMLPREGAMSLDLWSVVFAVAISMLATFLFGLAPGLSRSEASVDSALRESGRTASGSVATRQRIALLASAQAMLAFLSLFGAGLFFVTNRELLHVSLGFDPRNIASMLIPLGGAKYSASNEIGNFYRRVEEQAAATPGIRQFALGSDLPLNGALEVNFIRADRPRPPRGQEPNSLDRIVTPGYFHLFKIPILEGRGFTDHDSESAPRVAIVNENLARHFFPREIALGKQLLIVGENDPNVPEGKLQIVGIAANVKELGLNEVDFDDVYLPFAQNPDRVMFAIVKTDIPAAGPALLRKKLQSLDTNEFVADARTMDSYVSEALRQDRFRLSLVSAFALVALLLTVIALYGAISFSVAQRTRELGLRMALGAQRTGVLRLTLMHVLRLAFVGSACGFVVAFILGEIFAKTFYLIPHEHVGMLYGVGIHDPASFACAALLVFLFAALAGLVPGIRAARIDPYEALRCD